MTWRALSQSLSLVALAGLLAACGDSTTSPSSTPDAQTTDGAGSDDGSADALSDAPADAATDAASCPVACPTGQILVTWSLSSPGFPGPSGCACKPDPCPDGGVGCPCDPACQQVAPGGGCCNWSGSALSCNACG